jgi:SAM-dependent methyltransferase
VIAVEPLPEMRAILAAKSPGAELLDGTAEELPLGTASIDAVTVGQAFHWFDAERALAEIGRVLRPDGALGLIWNVRDLSDPLQSALQELLAGARRSAPSEHEQPWRASIAASPRFAAGELRSFAWEQPHTASELSERVASVSFVAALDEGERAPLLARVRALVAGEPEPFPFRYRTDVYVYRRGG